MAIYRFGAKGIPVLKMKSSLNSLGYSVGVVNDTFDNDAVFGLKRFQEDHALNKDGEFGPLSQAALNAAIIQASKSPDSLPTAVTPTATLSDWYPKAVLSEKKMPTSGRYKKGYPVGAIVHYTAGGGTAQDTINYGIQQGYTYLCIGRDGKMVQAHPMSRWGWHAGESKWTAFAKKLVGQVSDDLVGIETVSYGLLTEKTIYDEKLKKNRKALFAWTGREIPYEQARFTIGRDNQSKGWYEKFTMAQEEKLIEFLLWMKSQAPLIFDFDLVLGHDEVSGKRGLGYWRKVDPGAALSLTMDEFRSVLKQRWSEMQAKLT